MSFYILPVDIGLGDGAGIPVRLHSIPSILTISSPQTLSVRRVAKLPPFPADDEEPEHRWTKMNKIHLSVTRAKNMFKSDWNRKHKK